MSHYILVAVTLIYTLLFFNLAISISATFKKHRKAYLVGNSTRTDFVRRTSLEILGILLAMTLAGLLGRVIVQSVTAQITNEIAKFVTCIIIGLLAGVGVGYFVIRTWEKMIRTNH